MLGPRWSERNRKVEIPAGWLSWHEFESRNVKSSLLHRPVLRHHGPAAFAERGAVVNFIEPFLLRPSLAVMRKSQRLQAIQAHSPVYFISHLEELVFYRGLEEDHFQLLNRLPKVVEPEAQEEGSGEWALVTVTFVSVHVDLLDDPVEHLGVSSGLEVAVTHCGFMGVWVRLYNRPVPTLAPSMAICDASSESSESSSTGLIVKYSIAIGFAMVGSGWYPA